MSIDFTIVENARIYYDGVKEWRRKDTVENTWKAFKTFFAIEFREIRVHPSTSSSEGYGTTTNMRGGHANAAEFERQQQQAEALANFATATAADRQAVAELSISNATLTHEFHTATATIATLQQRLASCECAPTPRIGKKGQKQRQQNPSRDFTPLDPDRYFWSHGYNVSRGHNGASCYNTLPGYQSVATRADPMGGSTKNKPE